MTSTDVLQVPIPWDPAGQAYGRNIRHDPRSRAYRIGRGATPRSVEWPRHIPVLDQGQLGSCTGNAKVGQLGTGPFWDALSDTQRATLNEDTAVQIYAAATRIDDEPDFYDIAKGEVDTGSDGLSVSKISVQDGYESGYQHALSLAEAHAAIQAGPFIAGTLFYEAMEEPDRNGLVLPRGKVVGGHEYECFKYDLASDTWWFYNSWSDDWGKHGTFGYTSAVLTKLLAQQGDITVGVPLDRPKPQPAPAPADGVLMPTGLVSELDAWALAPHQYRGSTALAGAWRTFRGTR